MPCRLTPAVEFGLSAGVVDVAGRHAVGKKADMSLRAQISQFGNRAAAAEHFVIGVGGDDQDSFSHLQSRV